MTNQNPILEFNNVYKSYKIKSFLSTIEKKVLTGVSFEIYPGEIVGVLGINGAGKTTIIKIICGIIRHDDGYIRVFSKDISDVNYLTRIGYLSEMPYFSQNFSVRETVEFFNSISTNKATQQYLNELYEMFSIKRFLNEKIKNLSKGMLQKVALTVSMVNNPDLLILDEPTTGLDPIYIKNIRDILINLNENGKTIFFSSHTISEVEKICNRVIIINKGRVVKVIKREEFRDELETIFIQTIENDF